MGLTARLSDIREALGALGVNPNTHRLCLFLSGGADSTYLLHAMARLWPDRQKLSAITIDYQLRGPASAGDAEGARLACLGLQVPCQVVTVVGGPRGNTQQWARLTRRRLMAGVLKRGEADFIATGHQGDDRIEGFLLRLFQGQTPTLVPPRRGLLIRPLLMLGRAEIRKALTEDRISWREDQSNREAVYLRNRLRLHVVAPLDRAGLSWREPWAHAFSALSGRDELCASLARSSPYLKSGRHRIRLKAPFHSLPPAAATALLAQALRLAFPGRRFSRFDFEKTLSAAKGPKAQVIFPYRGRPVEIDRGLIAPVEAHHLNLPLSPATGTQTPWGLSLGLMSTPTGQAHVAPLPGYTGGELQLKSPIAGDHFHPKGQGGPVRLTRWLMNHRVPRFSRRRALVVCEKDVVYGVLAGGRYFPGAQQGPSPYHLTWGFP